MRIKHILSLYRNDFQAVYTCEHCGHSQEGYGYNDDYFYDHVIPTMTCKKCGRSSRLGEQGED